MQVLCLTQLFYNQLIYYYKKIYMILYCYYLDSHMPIFGQLG